MAADGNGKAFCGKRDVATANSNTVNDGLAHDASLMLRPWPIIRSSLQQLSSIVQAARLRFASQAVRHADLFGQFGIHVG